MSFLRFAYRAMVVMHAYKRRWVSRETTAASDPSGCDWMQRHSPGSQRPRPGISSLGSISQRASRIKRAIARSAYIREMNCTSLWRSWPFKRAN